MTFKKLGIYGFIFGLSSSVFASSFILSENINDSVVNEFTEGLLYVHARQEDTLLDIARRFDMGQNEVLRLNPTVDRWMPKEGTTVALPNNRILPHATREGIVLNLPEFRLYYYPSIKDPESLKTVTTHPVSIGRRDWNTPLGKTKITEKKRNPTWTPPASIKKEHAEKGDPLPNVVPAGEDNPLGLFALRLGIPGYLIHSTNKPYGVGMRVSHGCIRMYPEDIEKLFEEVRVGTKVQIVNQPIKVGWRGNHLYIEVHPELQGEEMGENELWQLSFTLIEQVNNQQIPAIDKQALNQALREKKGIPRVIFKRPAGVTRWNLE